MLAGVAGCKALLVGSFGGGFAMLGPIRAALDDLDAFVHPEVVPILPQLPSQRIYRYNQLCFHFF